MNSYLQPSRERSDLSMYKYYYDLNVTTRMKYTLKWNVCFVLNLNKMHLVLYEHFEQFRDQQKPEVFAD